MFTTIEQWQARADRDPVIPAARSSLATDDLAYPAVPASQVAYNVIITAVEHLHLFASAFQATALLYPSAYHPGLRTALIAAAQAVWVLGDTRPERRRHALEIVIDDINQRCKTINDLGDLTSERQALAETELARLTQLLNEATTAAATAGLTLSQPSKHKLTMERVIKKAVALANPQATDDAKVLRDGAGLLWRTGSGHAHATLSSRMRMIKIDGVTHRPDGSMVGRPDTRIEDITLPAMAAFLLTNTAWRLYDQRCQPAAP
jgi:hypothetical protein